MNASRTLASRFRSQRTDRVRLDGNEVFSTLTFNLRSGEACEVIIDDATLENPQTLVLHCEQSALRTPETTEPTNEVAVDASRDSPIEITSDLDDTLLYIWNEWTAAGANHAWIGNSGIIVEDMEVPEGARERVRLWCSDGLGETRFDDLVAVITIG